jgi:hypothetical protein
MTINKLLHHLSVTLVDFTNSQEKKFHIMLGACCMYRNSTLPQNNTVADARCEMAPAVVLYRG